MLLKPGNADKCDKIRWTIPQNYPPDLFSTASITKTNDIHGNIMLYLWLDLSQIVTCL